MKSAASRNSLDLAVEVFHERNLDRQRDWPATLLATSTHDTKRSEDVRARMVAISEIPELWQAFVAALGHCESPLETDGE
jgi:Maltooligosyl trehalose synthase